MGYFKTHYGNAYTLALYCFLQGAGYAAGKSHKTAICFVVEVEDIVYLFFRDYQGMTFCYGTDIEECKVIVVLGNFVAGYFAGYDTTED